MTTTPKPPIFPVARDEVTEPGIGVSMETLTLKRENMRLRQERNEARQALADLEDRSSVPPPTRKQAAVAMTGKVVQWTGIAMLLLTAAAQVASMYRPDLEAPIRTLIKLVQGLG